MLEKDLKIGTERIDNRLILAPMAGITNLPFRLLATNLGAGLTVTEMVSAKGLVLGQKKTFSYLKTLSTERPFCVQIFGSDPEIMERAAEIVAEHGAGILDINMGCPVKKVVKTGAGAALLNEPDKVEQILTRVRRIWPGTLTLKMRAGWRPGRVQALEISKIAESCGTDAITIHPRFASQGFSGHAQWDIIKKIKNTVKIPIIGNGDIFKPWDAIKMVEQTGCDGVMIGRGAIGNPWIFRQVLELEAGRVPHAPSIRERRQLMLQHFQLLCEDMGEGHAARVMRGLLMRYTKGLPLSTRFRAAIGRIRDYETLVSIMNEYFKTLEHTES